MTTHVQPELRMCTIKLFEFVIFVYKILLFILIYIYYNYYYIQFNLNYESSCSV
jgi:hypothetical protein